MASHGIAKQKRNKPCENCRAHRRKCFVAQGMQCERCYRMELPCVFKFTIKPDISRKTVPVSKRNRMLDQVHLLEDDVAAMEEQLRALNVALQLQHDNNHNDNNDDDDNISILRHTKRQRRDDDDDGWQLTLSRSADGLQFQTNIKSVADIAMFLQRSMPYFSLSTPARQPTYYVDKRLQRLTVTNKMLFIEQLLRSLFGSKVEEDNDTTSITTMIQQQPSPSSSFKSCCSPVIPTWSRTFIKLHFYDSFFHCFGLIHPVLVRPYYQHILRNQPDSMLTTAIAAFIGYSQCQHVHVDGMTLMYRRAMAESFRQEARQLLEDSMFEKEPDIEMMGTLVLLGQCSLILLRNSEARITISMAWRMALELRHKYMEILDADPNTVDWVVLAEAESWRRMFYMIRYLEISLHIIHDGRANISDDLLHDNVGYPVLLPCEQQDPVIRDSILLYQQVVRMNECHIFTKVDETGYRLMAGTVQSVRCTDIEHLENQMFAFWRSMPSEFKLSDGPMEYLDQRRVQQCRDYHVLYLNKLYYSTWLSLEARVMHAPEETNLMGASLNRIDGERALLIVSICTDALARIFQELHDTLPCIVELHLVLVASDAMKMLRNSPNAAIRARATDNLYATLRVLKHYMDLMSPSDGYNNTILTSAFSDPAIDHNQGMLTPYSESSQSTLQTTSDDDDDDESLSEYQHRHHHNHNHHRHHSPCTTSSSATTTTTNNNSTNSAVYFTELKRALEVYFSGHGYSSI
ncbi:hypothetical protein O0I10_007878 [Lichtheimia ornata]|uniref:Zn(2)-C6 fungal-type domain-containing protein n=1 Tax=Lichtheimia ornata TaxID=688661 RepID=A0AAD7XW10_9FUNG|nr:uncharacterized protein O0I10_007878 [Lichtheimia ornata]KAJ8656555.1 hypothetical protein O0I10_007878 [Lichtheimia ornata]